MLFEDPLRSMVAVEYLSRCLAGSCLEVAVFHVSEAELMVPLILNGKDRCSLRLEACDSGQASSDMEVRVVLLASHLASFLPAGEEGTVCDRGTLAPGLVEAVLHHSFRSCMAGSEQCHWSCHTGASVSEAVGASACWAEKSYFDFCPASSVAVHTPLSATFPEEVALQRYWHKQHLVEDAAGELARHGEDAGHSIGRADYSVPYSVKR
jgi:hypothetical protein